jgi:hypothetical protein
MSGKIFVRILFLLCLNGLVSGDVNDSGKKGKMHLTLFDNLLIIPSSTMVLISSSLKKLSFELYKGRCIDVKCADVIYPVDTSYWAQKIQSKFGLPFQSNPDIKDFSWILREIYLTLEPIPPDLIKACGVSGLILRNDMGPNKEFYPNHGYYRESNKTVTLNSDIFVHPDQPDDFFDPNGYHLTRAQQTIYHEFGHGFDANFGEISLQPAWMVLSGWSKEFKPGLEKLHIKEKGAPEVTGEYYYNPKAHFTRFYARRNPYDDFADSFSFYIAGLKDKVPPNKAEYFAKLLKKFY